jgi:hypothetical protein
LWLNGCAYARLSKERKMDERKREEMQYFHCLEQQRNSRERPKLCGSHVCSSSLLNSEEMQKGSSLFLFFQFYPSLFASVCAKWLGSWNKLANVSICIKMEGKVMKVGDVLWGT